MRIFPQSLHEDQAEVVTIAKAPCDRALITTVYRAVACDVNIVLLPPSVIPPTPHHQASSQQAVISYHPYPPSTLNRPTHATIQPLEAPIS